MIIIPGPKTGPTKFSPAHATNHMRTSLILFNGIAAVRAPLYAHRSYSTSFCFENFFICFSLQAKKFSLIAWRWPVGLLLTRKTPVVPTRTMDRQWSSLVPYVFRAFEWSCRDNQVTLVPRTPLPLRTHLHSFFLSHGYQFMELVGLKTHKCHIINNGIAVICWAFDEYFSLL